MSSERRAHCRDVGYGCCRCVAAAAASSRGVWRCAEGTHTLIAQKSIRTERETEPQAVVVIGRGNRRGMVSYHMNARDKGWGVCASRERPFKNIPMPYNRRYEGISYSIVVAFLGAFL